MSIRKKIETHFLNPAGATPQKPLNVLGGTFLLALILLAWIGFRQGVLFSQLHLEWLVLLAMVLGFWSGSLGLRWLAILLFAGGILLGHHLFITLPHWEQKLQHLAANNPPIWIRGKILQTQPAGKMLQVKLSAAEVFVSQEKQHFSEITVQFLFKKSQASSFYRQRPIQFSGMLAGAVLEQQQLIVQLEKIHYHTSVVPAPPWLYFVKILHHHLGKRAAFYLSADAFALYSPLILAQSVYRSEPSQLFRATGVAHLLTISGLHIGLLFWLGLLFFKQWGRFSEKWLLWVHFPRFCQGATLLVLWAYVTLLAFPIPALRALVMLSLMVLIRWMGQVQAPLYALLTTAFLFMGYEPSVIHNLSFQLSFVAVFYILLSLPFLWNASRALPLWKKALCGAGNSLVVTGSVLVGLWPLLVTHFQQLSLEVFWLNLVLLPMLAFVILPLGFAAFLISLFHYKALPFGFLEKTIFQGVEWALESWLEVLKILHHWGGWATFSVELRWDGWHYLLYYLATALIYYGLAKHRSQGGFSKHQRSNGVGSTKG